MIIGTVVVSVLILVGIVVLISSRTVKEKGPMPKRHGGFGQTVHGGKS